MGNTNGKRNNRKLDKNRINELLGLCDGSDADVETLRLTFAAFRRILVHLTLHDLSICMRVCKEWRSIIDSCAFWRMYLEAHYDCSVRDIYNDSPLYRWREDPNCIRFQSTLSLQSDASGMQPFVFKPFPDTWSCDIVVPYALKPPDGSIDTYHHFLQALNWLHTVRTKGREFRLTNEVEAVLLPWFKGDRLPSAQEVLILLGAHNDIVRTVDEAKPLTKQEMKNALALLRNGNSKKRGLITNEEFFKYLANNVGDRTIIFDCNSKVVSPTPSLIITRLSPNWIGGLLYAI